MKKFFKFIFSLAIVSAIVAGVLYFVKNILMKDYLDDYDDDFDNTYATYVFSVPEKWKEDFDKIVDGKIRETSLEYQNYLREFFPLLEEKGIFDKIFLEE